MERRKILLITSALGAGLIAGCGDTEDDASTPTATSGSPEPDPTDTPIDPHIRSEVASGLDVPWGIAFLASGDALVSMRETGDVVRVTAAGDTETVGTVPGVIGGRHERVVVGLLVNACPPISE